MRQSVDVRSLVHKSESRNIWLSAAELNLDGSLKLSFEIPADLHPRFAEYVEVQRQATHAFAHLCLSVPDGALSMLETAEIVLSDAMLQETRIPHAGHVVVYQSIAGAHRGGVFDINVTVEFFTTDGAIAVGKVSGKYLPQRLYDRLRTSTPMRTVPEIAGTYGEAPPAQIIEPFVVDLTNPILSDHDTDHVSGMAVICATEQIVALYLPNRALMQLSTAFLAFIEKDSPAFLELKVTGNTFITTVVQGDRLCARSDGIIGEREKGDHLEAQR